jgi:hypothetical protein
LPLQPGWVEVVLSLLTHCERAGHRHFHLPAGVALEELQVVDLDWAHAANRPDDAGTGLFVSAPPRSIASPRWWVSIMGTGAPASIEGSSMDRLPSYR